MTKKGSKKIKEKMGREEGAQKKKGMGEKEDTFIKN